MFLIGLVHLTQTKTLALVTNEYGNKFVIDNVIGTYSQLENTSYSLGLYRMKEHLKCRSCNCPCINVNIWLYIIIKKSLEHIIFFVTY